MDVNEKQAYRLYRKGGQHLVYDCVTKGLLIADILDDPKPLKEDINEYFKEREVA